MQQPSTQMLTAATPTGTKKTFITFPSSWMSMLSETANLRKQMGSTRTKSAASKNPASNCRAAPKRTVALRREERAGQASTCAKAARRSASAAVSSATLACSGRGCESSSLRSSTVLRIVRVATRQAPAWQTAATPVHAVVTALHKVALPSLSLVKRAPTRVWGAILAMKTGRVPRIICGMLSFRMPQVTLVGQSGPPTKIATFPGCIPRWFSTYSMARVGTVSTPIIFCTLTLLPSTKPMPYWPQHATNFATRPSKEARMTPHQKPIEA
mmetsp:Transcript_45622/g.97828  ORF Transcript_45622/g.97828 Transcript_45622/m.97828 type:complete len:270 (-) Transcript_45622:247-1056(-)